MISLTVSLYNLTFNDGFVEQKFHKIPENLTKSRASLGLFQHITLKASDNDKVASSFREGNRFRAQVCYQASMFPELVL